MTCLHVYMICGYVSVMCMRCLVCMGDVDVCRYAGTICMYDVHVCIRVCAHVSSYTRVHAGMYLRMDVPTSMWGYMRALRQSWLQCTSNRLLVLSNDMVTCIRCVSMCMLGCAHGGAHVTFHFCSCGAAHHHQARRRRLAAARHQAHQAAVRHPGD